MTSKSGAAGKKLIAHVSGEIALVRGTLYYGPLAHNRRLIPATTASKRLELASGEGSTLCFVMTAPDPKSWCRSAKNYSSLTGVSRCTLRIHYGRAINLFYLLRNASPARAPNLISYTSFSLSSKWFRSRPRTVITFSKRAHSSFTNFNINVLVAFKHAVSKC